MRLALALAVVAAALPGAGASGGAGFAYDRALAWWAATTLEVASRHSGSQRKRIPLRTYVRCYDGRAAFERPLLARGASPLAARSTIAYYDRGGTVHLRGGTCERARRFAAGALTQDTAGAFTTLLHEALHRQGFRDENATECWAISSIRFAGRLVHAAAAPGATPPAPTPAAERFGERALLVAYRSSLAGAAAEYLVSADCLDRAERESWADYLRGR